MEIVRDCESLDVGGKAANLCRLRRFCTVPGFFVLRLDSPEELNDIGNQERIREECELRGFSVLAIRSSASCEDADEASFAGMFESVVGVGLADVRNAVLRVSRSMRADRVEAYAVARGLPAVSVQMHVIVQRCVRSRVSGVCFTRATTPDELVVEACYGLGEALVGGQMQPDTYVLRRTPLALVGQKVRYQSAAIRFHEELERVGSVPIPFHQRAAQKLSQSEVLGVARASLMAETQLGEHALDVEWAFEGDELLILQARPLGRPQARS